MSSVSTQPKRSLIADVSDLMSYFIHSRLPTGIQRFQIKLSARWMEQPYSDTEMTIACYDSRTGVWVPLPKEPYAHTIQLAVAGGDVDDPEWRSALSALREGIDTAEPIAFRPGTILFNPSPAFWIQDYYLALRAAKARSCISYLPYIHDCIPVVVPELCDRGIPRAFVNVLAGLFHHSRHFQANSRASANDLMTIATQLGHCIPEPEVVVQDARFSELPPVLKASSMTAVHGLQHQRFVLFIATIEPRKNHMLAFRAWLEMLRKRGPERTPKLVCVGKRGWRSETAFSFLEASDLLREKVLVLTKVNDDDIAELYRRCLFTVFPSIYEGWGLPVTEALSYGKVPLTTRTSSLGEAGGNLAEYFDHLSVRDMVEKLERLIDDNAYREARAMEIKQKFRPRGWGDVADEIVEKALAQTAKPSAGKGGAIVVPAPSPVAEPDRYYAVATLPTGDLWPGMVAGEMFRFGPGWWSPEDWGTWMRYGRAELAFSLMTGKDNPYILHLGLVSPPSRGADYHVRVQGNDVGEEGDMCAGEHRWITLPIEPTALRCRAVRIEITTTTRCYLGERSRDARTIGLGLLGFFVCRENDLLTRHRFIEALHLNGLNSLSGRPEVPSHMPLIDENE